MSHPSGTGRCRVGTKNTISPRTLARTCHEPGQPSVSVPVEGTTSDKSGRQSACVVDFSSSLFFLPILGYGLMWADPMM